MIDQERVELMANWIRYAARIEPEALELTDEQIVALGAGLSRNGLLNPPTPASFEKKLLFYRCEYCGKPQFRTYRTRQPRYCSNSCRQAAYRERAKNEDQKCAPIAQGALVYNP